MNKFSEFELDQIKIVNDFFGNNGLIFTGKIKNVK